MKIENLALELTRKIAVPIILSSVGTALLFHIVRLPDRIFTGPSYQVEYSDESPAYIFLSEDDKWRLPVQLDRVDPNYLEALIRYEDKRFYRHNGLDLLAIARAFATNIKKGAIGDQRGNGRRLNDFDIGYIDILGYNKGCGPHYWWHQLAIRTGGNLCGRGLLGRIADALHHGNGKGSGGNNIGDA